MTHNIHQFPELLQLTGIDPNKLGCVMLPVEPYDVLAGREYALLRSDLHTSPDPERFWIKGDIASAGGHVTLLYGLIEHATDLVNEINAALETWNRPTFLTTSHVTVFPSPYADEDYGCVVAKIDVDEALHDAHARLSYLPHVDTHPDYQPHVTLAYVRADRAQDWADILNLNPPFFEVKRTGLDLGTKR